MIAYYAPSILTTETVMLSSTQPTEEYIPVETDTLTSLGFKKAFLDGVPIPLEPASRIFSNPLYFQLYRNTKQKKWLEKIDKGMLYVPIMLQSTQADSLRAQPKKLYRKVDGCYYVIAFLTPEDFVSLTKNGDYKGYRLVYADRTEHYVVNGIIL